MALTLNPTSLRKAKIVCNFGLSECNRVKGQNLLTRKLFLLRVYHHYEFRQTKMKLANLLLLKIFPFTLYMTDSSVLRC